MAKKRSQKKAEKPPPTCKAILLCDSTIVDAQTGKVSVIGIFDRFFVLKFPGHTSPFTVFLQLVHGSGRYEVVVEMRDLRDDTILARSPIIAIEYPEKLFRMNLMLPVPPVPVAHAGEYELLVLANRQAIDRQRFSVVSPEETSHGNEDG